MESKDYVYTRNGKKNDKVLNLWEIEDKFNEAGYNLYRVSMPEGFDKDLVIVGNNTPEDLIDFGVMTAKEDIYVDVRYVDEDGKLVSVRRDAIPRRYESYFERLREVLESDVASKPWTVTAFVIHAGKYFGIQCGNAEKGGYVSDIARRVLPVSKEELEAHKAELIQKLLKRAELRKMSLMCEIAADHEFQKCTTEESRFRYMMAYAEEHDDDSTMDIFCGSGEDLQESLEAFGEGAWKLVQENEKEVDA